MTVLSALLLLVLAGPCRAAKPSRDADQKKTYEHLISLARRSLNKADYPRAVEQAASAARVVPGATAYNIQAQALNLQRKHVEAEAAARNAIRLNRKTWTGYENLALAQLHQDKFAEAMGSATAAISLKPKSALAHALRAFACEALGDEAGKMRDIEQAARLDGERFKGHLAAAKAGRKIFARGRPETQGGVSPGLLALFFAGAALGGWAFLRAGRKKAPSRWRKPAASSRPRPAEPEKDLLAGKYRLTRVIGKGGMGEVWEAVDRTLDRPVAVKMMSAAVDPKDARAKEGYLKEAKILAALRHPNIVGIYEILDLPKGVYLVFELLKGKTVQQILVERKSLPLSKTKKILRQVCQALSFAHSRGIVHRDLKPSNIMVADRGYVKIMDFGISKEGIGVSSGHPSHDPSQVVLSRRVWRTLSIGGTPAYMPPEAARGVISAGCDVYALGVCLYEMLTDELPFASAADAIKGDFKRADARVPGLPPAVDELLSASLEPQLDKRLSSVKEFMHRLERIPEPA